MGCRALTAKLTDNRSDLCRSAATTAVSECRLDNAFLPMAAHQGRLRKLSNRSFLLATTPVSWDGQAADRRLRGLHLDPGRAGWSRGHVPGFRPTRSGTRRARVLPRRLSVHA